MRGRAAAATPPRHRCTAGGVAHCRVGDTNTGGLWITRHILWTTLDRAPPACGQRSTDARSSVTICCHEPTALPRPTLLPGLTRLWRDRHTLQLGARPGPGRRCWRWPTPAPPACSTCSTAPAANAPCSPQAGAARVAADEARALLDALRGAGLVVPAHSLLPRDLAGPARGPAGRRGRRAGPGRARPARHPGPGAAPTAGAPGCWSPAPGRLGAPRRRRAGPGRRRARDPGADRPGRARPTWSAPGSPPTDLGRPLAPAVRAAVDRVAPGHRHPPAAPEPGPDLVVQLGVDRPAALLAAGFAQRRQPHLLLTLREGVPVVGPLVRPPAGPCLRCVDLHRDRPRPGVAAARRPARRRPGRPGLRRRPPCSPPRVRRRPRRWPTSTAASPETLGGAVEIAGPAPLVRHRRCWPPTPGR